MVLLTSGSNIYTWGFNRHFSVRNLGSHSARPRGTSFTFLDLSTRKTQNYNNSIEKRENGAGQRTFRACSGVRSGHHGFVDADPLKGGDDWCSVVDGGAMASWTMAATAGRSRLQQRKRQWSRGGGFPLLLRTLRSGQGFRWVWRRTGEPRFVCRRPPPFFIAQCNGGPPTIKGWAPPIRARIKGLIGRWAYQEGDQPNKIWCCNMLELEEDLNSSRSVCIMHQQSVIRQLKDFNNLLCAFQLVES